MFTILDRFSEFVMLCASLVALVACGWNWLKEKEYASLGYLVPVLYFCLMYAYVVLFQSHDEIAQQMFGRAGVFIFLMDVVVWRVVFIRRRQRRRYGEY